MTQYNHSNSTSGNPPGIVPSGAEHTAFQGAQSALARKPLPGPRWAWPGLAALAVAAVAYLVAGTSGEHAGHRAAPSPSAETAPPAAPNPATTTVAALQPAAAAPTNPPASPATAPVNDLAASPPKGEADPAKAGDASEPAVASASAGTKKKARGAARRAKGKRAAPAR